MTRACRFLPLLLLAAAAHAEPSLRYSWDACDPLVTNQDFAGPGTYSQTLSAVNLTGPITGFRVLVGVGHPVFPAWQFYAHGSGCQGGARLSASPQVAACAEFPGVQISVGMDPGITDPVHAFIEIDGYPVAPFTPDPSTRYGLVTLVFDHTHSAAGYQNPPTCGDADEPECFHILGSYLFHDQQPAEPFVLENGFITWQDARNVLGCPGATPARARTWGSIKTLYR